MYMNHHHHHVSSIWRTSGGNMIVFNVLDHPLSSIIDGYLHVNLLVCHNWASSESKLVSCPRSEHGLDVHPAPRNRVPRCVFARVRESPLPTALGHGSRRLVTSSRLRSQVLLVYLIPTPEFAKSPRVCCVEQGSMPLKGQCSGSIRSGRVI